MFTFTSKKTVDSVMTTFTTAINDLQSVAASAKLESQMALYTADKLRQQTDQRIAELAAQASIADSEATRAATIISKLTALIS